MTDTRLMKLLLHKRILIISGLLFSGLCWYLSNGLSGNYGCLLWLAPFPVLLISLKVSGREAFAISFIAYLIGRLSWFPYLVTVATVIPAIIFTLLFPLVVAFIITITKQIFIKSSSWYTAFVFPVFFTTFEFLLMVFSSDGTAGSIAYSQSNILPVIQIASLTGILGITFLVTLIPSLVAFGLYYRTEPDKLKPIIATSSILIVSVLLFGLIRINRDTYKSTIKAGLVVLDEKLHDMSAKPDFQKEILTVDHYTKKISELAAKGAKLVVLPERAINIDSENDSVIMSLLKHIAKQNSVSIIAGYTNFKGINEHNSALIIDAEGNLLTDYNKVHLVTGLEKRFTPGNDPGLFGLNGTKAGIAICKDLDFQNYINQYGRSEIEVLCIPAWDFVIDDWLHSRMAVLRGVENGSSEVRTARLGRLTISDCFGRVNYEVSCSNGKGITLVGDVSLQKRKTIYSQFGNWFGMMNLLITIMIVLKTAIKYLTSVIRKRKIIN
jgi:apolipoprotein N-acyltransferase